MTPVEELTALYDTYSETLKQVRQKASPFAGFFGFGDDPRRHSCHDEFYEAVEKWTEDFIRSQPDRDQITQVVRWVLEAADRHRDEETCWFLYAIQGFMCPLIPKLPQETCEELRQWYKGTYPREKQMPVQRDIYKLLVQYSGQNAAPKSVWKRIFGKK